MLPDPNQLHLGINNKYQQFRAFGLLNFHKYWLKAHTCLPVDPYLFIRLNVKVHSIWWLMRVKEQRLELNDKCDNKKEK